jgi:hypothetical protein
MGAPWWWQAIAPFEKCLVEALLSHIPESKMLESSIVELFQRFGVRKHLLHSFIKRTTFLQ